MKLKDLDLTDINNQIFRFLKDTSQSGLRNAVSLQGGIEYLKNTRLGAKDISIKIVYYPGCR